MYYYQRLKDLREDEDLKQTDIAELLQITQQQYSLYEKGKREIPLHLAIKLAKYYKVSIDYIVGFTNNKGSLHKLNKDEQQVLEIYNGLSERNKGKLELYAEQLQEAEIQMKEIG